MSELLFVTFFLNRFSKKFLNDELVSAVLVNLVLWFSDFLIVALMALLFSKLTKNLGDGVPY